MRLPQAWPQVRHIIGNVSNNMANADELQQITALRHALTKFYARMWESSFATPLSISDQVGRLLDYARTASTLVTKLTADMHISLINVK